MAFLRLTSFSPLLVLSFLGACNQTAAPVANQGLVGSGAIAAINDLQATQARHRLTSTAINFAGGFDSTGMSVIAIDRIEEEQARIEDEKSRRVDEEVEKALAEAEALQALTENLERRKRVGSSSKTSRQKPTP
jgi:hypothetical protein